MNPSNMFISGNPTYLEALSKLKYWAISDADRDPLKSVIADEITLTLSMIPAKC